MRPKEVMACLSERASAWKLISGVSSGVRLREDNLHTQEEQRHHHLFTTKCMRIDSWINTRPAQRFMAETSHVISIDHYYHHQYQFSRESNPRSNPDEDLLLQAAGQLVVQVVAAVGALQLMDDHIKLSSELKNKHQ